MVNNYDRIYHELCREAERIARTHGCAADTVVTLAMEIVNLVDEHRIRPIRIKKTIEEHILTTALSLSTDEEE